MYASATPANATWPIPSPIRLSRRWTRKKPTAGARTPMTAPVASASRMNSSSSMRVRGVVPDARQLRRAAVEHDRPADEHESLDEALDRSELVRHVEVGDSQVAATWESPSSTCRTSSERSSASSSDSCSSAGRSCSTAARRSCRASGTTPRTRMLELEFMRLALATGAVIGVLAPAVGFFLVQRRLSLIGDGIGHVAFAGVALAYIADLPVLATAFVVSILGALAIEWLRASGTAAADQALAIVFYVGIAAGIVGISVAGALDVQLFSFLFGSILTTTRADFATV